MSSEVFLENLEAVLRNSNPNLGRKSPKREQFIETILGMVREFVEETPTKTTTIKQQRLKALGPDRVLRTIPHSNRLSTKDGAAAVMTEAESMRADEELGNTPNMG